MRGSSTRYAAAVVDSHKRVHRLEVWRGGELLVAELPYTDGEIEQNGEQTVPGSLRCTVPRGYRGEWIPSDPFDPLAPFGQRIVAYSGIEYLDGTRELLLLGEYLIVDSDPDPLSGGIRVAANSLEQILADSLIPAPRKIPAANDYATEIENLIGHRLPVEEISSPTAIGPGRFHEQGSRLDAIVAMATAWGKRVRVDDQGVLRILPPREQSGDEVADLTTGERGVVADWAAPTSRQELYNAVYARGEEGTGDARPVAGYAYDSDPSSPTFYGGPFGERPLEYASPLLTTRAQCRDAAASILARRIARRRVVEVEMVPDLRLELDDLCRVQTPTLDVVGQIASITYPLDAGRQRLTLDGAVDL